MPSIRDAIARNQQRISQGGITGADNSPAAPSPSVAAPPEQIPNLPSRGVWPANMILGSDVADQSQVFQKNAVRSRSFPFPPAPIPVNKTTVVQTSGGGGGTSIELETNNIPNPSQTLLNLIAGTNITIMASPGGGVTIASTSAGDGLIHGTTPWETDPSSFILAEDFNVYPGTILGTTAEQGPIGLNGWVFNSASSTVMSNQTTSAWGALFGGIGGSISWENSSTQGSAATLYPNSITTSTPSTTPAAMALLDYPGWMATFVWKFDGTILTQPGKFVTTKKAFYIGLAGNFLQTTATNATNLPEFAARPMVFIGLRFDTSTGPGSITLASVGNSSSGKALYSFASTTSLASNGSFVGQKFTIAGFTNASNNGTFTCSGSAPSGLVLENNAAVAESHSATATSNASLNDSFYTAEAVFNPAYTTGVPRNNAQGQTAVTSVAVAAGVAHRLDITCAAIGTVTLYLDGVQIATFTIPQMTVVLQYSGSGQSINYFVTNNQASISMATQGGSSFSLSANNPQATLCPFAAGSKVTFAGVGLAGLNSTFLMAATVPASNEINFTTSGISNTSGSVSNGATATGYPALTPFASFGNDDTAIPTGSTMRFYWDYCGLAVNPGVNGGTGTPNPSLPRYF